MKESKKNIFLEELKAKPMAYTLQILGVAVIILNLWLVTKLAPLAQDINSLNVEVLALQTGVTELKSKSGEHAEFLVELKTIGVRLEDVSARIQRIDNRLSKHLGI